MNGSKNSISKIFELEMRHLLLKIIYLVIKIIRTISGHCWSDERQEVTGTSVEERRGVKRAEVSEDSSSGGGEQQEPQHCDQHGGGEGEEDEERRQDDDRDDQNRRKRGVREQ